MSTHFADIESALQTKLKTIAGSPEIAWPNIEFVPTVDTLYLRPTLLPTSHNQASLGANGQDRFEGIFQVDVFFAAKSGGSVWPDTIADLFKRGTSLTVGTGQLTISKVELEPLQNEQAWCMIPVSIYFFAYTEART